MSPYFFLQKCECEGLHLCIHRSTNSGFVTHLLRLKTKKIKSEIVLEPSGHGMILDIFFVNTGVLLIIVLLTSF